MYKDIQAFLIPFFAHENERQALLTSAFHDHTSLLGQINYSGTAFQFVSHVIPMLQSYGETTPGTQALWQLLLVLKERVGLDQQERIVAFEVWANTSQSIKPFSGIFEEVPKPPQKTDSGRQKIRVYIVDDHEIVRQGMVVTLEKFDEFDVIGTTGDARFGVREIVLLKPDIVLMDIEMPGMNGIQATKLIRQYCPEIQVVITTSFNDNDNIQSALKAGALSYVLKNVSEEELAYTVRRAYGGKPVLSPETTQALISMATRLPTPGHDLSEREREVLTLMVKGLSNREIADRLFISSSTVKNHVSNILEKFGTTSRTQAIVKAVEYKIVKP